MNRKIYRILLAVSTALLLIALASCSGSGENTQGASTTKSDEKTAVGQDQPADQQTQSREEMSKTEEQQPAAAQQETQSTETAEKNTESQQSGTMETTEITGTVMVGDAGVVIQTDQDEFTVSGQDLTAMAGKTVKIVGTIQETEGRKTIQVISVSEAQ